MKKYTEPAMKIKEFANENVVTVSGGSNANEAQNEIGTANVKITSYSDLFA